MIDALELGRSLSLTFFNYYLTTFILWFGHWFAHRKGGMLTAFHVASHHALYPDSDHMRTPIYVYPSGRHGSNYAFIPWLLLQVLLLFWLLPGPLFLMCFVQIAAIIILTGYIHENFHLLRPRLEPFGWFRRARDLQDLHHDEDVNFMIADHFWDRIFGTYRPVSEPGRLTTEVTFEREGRKMRKCHDLIEFSFDLVLPDAIQ